MTKEYLKMADAFVHDSVEALEQHIYAGYMSKHCCEYAAHAINSHDELVAEVERLREMVCRMGMYLEMSGEYPEKESDNPVRQWLYDSIQVMASGIDD